jgi:hypothetical protein
MKPKYVLVVGYGWSGSSAVIDLLREYQGFSTLRGNIEFRLINDFDGLMDLEYNLITNFSNLDSDIAVRRFKKFTNYLYRKPSRLFPIGHNYKYHIGPNFLEYTNDFINDLSLFNYKSRWWGLYYYIGALPLIIKMIEKKITFRKNLNIPDAVFPTSDSIAFLTASKKYIDKIFKNYFTNDVKTLIIDQAGRSHSFNKLLRYFDNSKLIIVDRNKSDITFELDNNSSFEIHDENIETWHSNLRLRKYKNDDAILNILFEDLVMNYEETKNLIEDFIGINKDDHIHPKKYFSPLISSKNINRGLFTKFRNK